MTMPTQLKYPRRVELITKTADYVYGQRVLNNAHRGDVVETMVWMALGDEWNRVGLGWHPWDLEKLEGCRRLRIQVKQTAAVQLWGETVTRTATFGWKSNPPSYFERDNPGETIESDGWFCELFVIGIHDEMDPLSIDQVDPAQWTFMVVPTCDLEPRTNSMVLHRARTKWQPVPWNRIQQQVARCIDRM